MSPPRSASSRTHVLIDRHSGFDKTDVNEYTTALLKWWKINHPTIPTWAKAARMVFAMTPSSAASERVFSLVESMFGKDQLRSLADQLQGSVMLVGRLASNPRHAAPSCHIQSPPADVLLCAASAWTEVQQAPGWLSPSSDASVLI